MGTADQTSDRGKRALPPLTIYVRDDGSTVHAALSNFDGAEAVVYVPHAAPSVPETDPCPWEEGDQCCGGECLS